MESYSEKDENIVFVVQSNIDRGSLWIDNYSAMFVNTFV